MGNHVTAGDFDIHNFYLQLDNTSSPTIDAVSSPSGPVASTEISGTIIGVVNQPFGAHAEKDINFLLNGQPVTPSSGPTVKQGDNIGGRPTADFVATIPLPVGGSQPVDVGVVFGNGNQTTPLIDHVFDITVVTQAPSITSLASAQFPIGTFDTFTFMTSGVPTSPTISEAEALPAGLKFTDNHDGTATLSGTPTGASGNFTLTITANNGVTPAATQSFTLSVAPATAPAISSAASVQFPIATADTFTVTTTGFPTPALAEGEALPAGFKFMDNHNGTATLSGTPTAGTSNPFQLMLTARNGVAPDATQVLTVTITSQVPIFTSAAQTTFLEGSPNNTFSVKTEGIPPPALTYTSLPALPANLTFTDNHDGTATLAGPGIANTYDLTITATNAVGSATQSFTLTVKAPEAPAIISDDHITLVQGAKDTFTVMTTGFPVPTLSVDENDLPGGVTFEDNHDGTATLAETQPPASVGTFHLTITAHNGVVPDATQTFTLTVNQPPAITSVGSAAFTENMAGTFTFTTTGVPTPTIREAGQLPDGVTFTPHTDGTATLGGTPKPGTGHVYTLRITATNGNGADAVQIFTLTVKQAPVITSIDEVTFIAGVNKSFTISATGVPPPSLSESGALPAGLTFVDNHNGTATLSGNPAARTGGSYPLTITASNGVGSDSIQHLTLTIDEAPAITTGVNHKTFDTGMAGTFLMTTSGYPIPVLGETGALPPGVKFVYNGDGTATLAGTVPAGTTGFYAITISAVNGVGTKAIQNFFIYVVTGTPPVVGPPRVLSLQRKGTGFQPTKIVLAFDQPMDLMLADLAGNYIIQPVVGGKVVASARRAIHVTSAMYNQSNQSVTLTTAKRLQLNQVYQITVNGHLPQGLTNEIGVLLDGSGIGGPGHDLIMRFSGSASLAGIPGPGQPLPMGLRSKGAQSTHHPAAAGVDWLRGQVGLRGTNHPRYAHSRQVQKMKLGK
jgi:hypothetical protein